MTCPHSKRSDARDPSKCSMCMPGVTRVPRVPPPLLSMTDAQLLSLSSRMFRSKRKTNTLVIKAR